MEEGTEGGASSHTWTPSSSSSSGGDGGGDFTSASSPSDGSLFLLESFLAALNPPSDSVFLLLVEEGRRAAISISCQGNKTQGKSKNLLEATTLVKVHLCVASPGRSPSLIDPFRNHYSAPGSGTQGVNMIKDWEEEGKDGVIQVQEVEERPQREEGGRAGRPPGFL